MTAMQVLLVVWKRFNFLSLYIFFCPVNLFNLLKKYFGYIYEEWEVCTIYHFIFNSKYFFVGEDFFL